MLVLTRRIQEQIQIGENITITILRLKGQAVRVGIDAPQDVRVVRGELKPAAADGPPRDDPDEGQSGDCGSMPNQRPAQAAQRPAKPSAGLTDSDSPPCDVSSAYRSNLASPRMPRACRDRRFASPLLAIATRRMRRRRAHFIPEGRI
jgi:carbon storage regulator CsrA